MWFPPLAKQSMSTTEATALTNVRPTTLTISAITNEALRLFESEYEKLYEPRYEIKEKYGKYKVIKYYGRDYKNAEVLVRGVSKEVAQGYVKLLKE